jgi:hypothetical protein
VLGSVTKLGKFLCWNCFFGHMSLLEFSFDHGPLPFTKLTNAEKITPFVVKSGNNSCNMCRMCITNFNTVISPSNSALKVKRQVLPDVVVALACTAPETRTTPISCLYHFLTPKCTLSDPKNFRRCRVHLGVKKG